MQLKDVLMLGLNMALLATGAPVQESAGSGVQAFESRINKDYKWTPHGAPNNEESPLERRINKDYKWTTHGAPDQQPALERRINKDYKWTPHGNQPGSE